MSQREEHEREALEGLVASPGWAYVVAHLQREYGAETYRSRVVTALGAPAMQGHAEVIKVEAAAAAVEAVLRWPRERIDKLRATVEDTPAAALHRAAHRL